jgi:preprotein translocase subunit SecA
LQSAVEAKERVRLKTQGRILGSITVQSLVRLYERICGMTGTAATQAGEFWKVYKLPVTVIPTNRPVIREDLPDIVYADKEARNRAAAEEIRKVHQTGRPILVGTASVEESEALSRRLQSAGIEHSVLNARNDEAEAEIIAQAGALRKCDRAARREQGRENPGADRTHRRRNPRRDHALRFTLHRYLLAIVRPGTWVTF